MRVARSNRLVNGEFTIIATSEDQAIAIASRYLGSQSIEFSEDESNADVVIVHRGGVVIAVVRPRQ